MNKRTVIAGILAIIFFITCIVGAVITLVGNQPAKDDTAATPSPGIFNPDMLGSQGRDEVENKDDRDKANAAKPTLTPEDKKTMDNAVLKRLSAMDFDGLSTYIMHSADQYQTDPYIQDLKVDVANTLSATETTAPIFLMAYRTPEVLAAAVAMFPMSYKLNAFLCADSLILPAQNSDIGLKIANVTEADLEGMLNRANTNTTSLTRCSDVAAYDMVINGLPCRLWEVETPNGWQPYLLEQVHNYTVGVLTQLEARKIQSTLYNSGVTLDQVIHMEYFDEAAYLADIKNNPEKYNEDGSLKKTDDEVTADAAVPADLQ